MTTLARWRGLTALVRDVALHGSRAVERVQVELLARPLALAAVVPSLAPVARVVGKVHGGMVHGTHVAIRVAVDVVAAGVDGVLAQRERTAATGR